MKHFSIKDITLISLFTALTIVGAFIKIPLPPPFPPLTLQFFFALSGGMLLGSLRGGMAQLIYIVLGLAGLPVFAKGGGITYIFQPTFGFIIGFALAAFICGFCANKVLSIKHLKIPFKMAMLFGCALLGMVICHVCGVAYMYMILNFYMGKATTFTVLLSVASLPFLFTDTLWCALTAMITFRLKKYIV